MADKVSTHSARPDRQSSRVRMRGAFSQRFGAFHELAYSLGRVTPAGHLCHFESHGPRDSINLAGAKGQQQMPALKVRAANEIYHAQASRHRPTDVDAKQIGFRNVARLAFR